MTPGDFITVGRVLALHARSIADHGGLAGLRDEGCPERSVGAAFSGALYDAPDGEDPDPLNVAARLLYYLARNHCFVDGNKRVAWLAFVDVIRAREVEINATVDDAESLVLDVAQGKVHVEDVIVWLAAPGRLVAVSHGALGSPPPHTDDAV